MKLSAKIAAGVALILTVGTLWAETAQLQANIREWDLPTARSRPHDPAAGPDGAIWYSGQVANKIGRVDPATGQIREFELKPKSGPHGLVFDREGNVWYTANFNGAIGKLDPKTGEVTEYPMPDASARDPHSLVFDQKGTLWFTVQGGNKVGRLDPKTGKIDLKEAPTPDARPYGIVVNSKGVPFFCELKVGKLASINPKTMEITEYPLPEGARPRRLAVAADDTLYYTDYERGYLGHFDPKTGKQQEWLSPSGPKSEPYGIAITRDGMVYYSESAVAPNTIVRFDPKTRQFASANIPSGGGVIRHMVVSPKGDLFIACSGINKVGVVELGKKEVSMK